MTLRFKHLYNFAFIALVFLSATVIFAQTKPYRVNDRQVINLITRIENKTNTFRRSLDTALDNSRIDGSNREDNINAFVRDFEDATNDLKNNFSGNRSTNNDVQEVLNRAVLINRFMQNNSLSRNTQNQWNSIRSDLNTLANYYRVIWNWNNQNNQNYPNKSQNNSFDSRLSGTYRLNTSQSDNVSNTVERAISKISYNDSQRERTQNNLERRLVLPETMMIEKRGQQITLASSLMSQVSFMADGKTRSETSDNGRTVKVRAASNNNDLTINYEGDRMNDYYVSFTPTNNNQLRISRRVYLENRNETVTIASVYDKTDQSPNWNTTSYPTTSDTNNVNNFIIPNNTRIMATLDSPLSTKTAKDNDRFTMTVNSPSQFNGATIEGRVIGEKSGVVSGRATLSLNFETIRLSNGSTYRFAGIVEKVRQPNGNNISVNNEGTVRDGSQTTKSVTRAGVGAVLGAIVGAIVGGGQGAAIGAGIGAGAGAVSVILQGRDNLDLPIGSEFTITATAPGDIVENR